MLLKLSKSRHPFWVFFIPVIAIALWLNSITTLSPQAIDYCTNTMPLYYYTIQLIASHSVSAQVIALILVVGCAFYLNRLNTKFIFIQERTYLPAFIYILLVSAFPPVKIFNPAIFASFFIIISFERIFDTYKKEHLTYNFFDASFFIGIASLFYFNSIFFLLFIWYSLATIRPFFWREWFYSVIGLLLPYGILIGVYYILNINNNLLFDAINYNFNNIIIIPWKLNYTVFFSYVGLILLITSLFILRFGTNLKIITRKAFNLFWFFLFFNFIIFIFLPNASFELIYIAALPASMLLAYYFNSVRPKKRNELIFDLLVIIIIVNQLL